MPRRRICASSTSARRAAPRAGANVTQMHYARRGIITPEMEFIAIRENQNLAAIKDPGLRKQHPGMSFGRRSRRHHTRVRAR